ncbi:MAG: hypothetical protein KAW95_03240 [Dehalococcoidia bacterium]|nr:hypothetical protein [Dehalococcoidia bacterium]
MSGISWAFPVLIACAIALTAGYFFGRRKNVLLMKQYASALEGALKPGDQTYTWVGGYIGFRAEYKVKSELVKRVKATLHLKPRMSLLYYPIALVTMRHDKLYLVVEVGKKVSGEGHLIRKGHYRVIPPGIANVERFRKREVALGNVQFELLSLDITGEKQLLAWAQGLKIDFDRVKHLSFTSSTDVIYAFVDPAADLIPVLCAGMLEFAGKVTK